MPATLERPPETAADRDPHRWIHYEETPRIHASRTCMACGVQDVKKPAGWTRMKMSNRPEGECR